MSVCVSLSRLCVCVSTGGLKACQDAQMHISAAAGQEEAKYFLFLLISDGQTEGSLRLEHRCFCQGPSVQSRRAEQL